MSSRHLPLTKSVIVDVLRAIVSRPIHSSRPLTSSRPLVLNDFKTNRSYSTQANSPLLIQDTPEKSLTQNNKKYHFLNIKDSTGQIRQVKGYTIKTKKERPSTVYEYNRLMLYALKEDRLNKAIRLFREMEKKALKPDIYSYTMIINGFSQQSDMGRANKWLHRMLQNNVFPDANVYTSLIDGYLREANVGRAEKIFGTMMKHEIKPSLVTYNVLMHHSVRKLDTASALKFWNSLLEAGLRSDVYTFAIILHGLGDEGRVDEAWRIFKTMQEQKVNVNTVVATTLMQMHVKQHDNAYSIELFEKFFGDGLKPTAHTKQVLLNAVLGKSDLEGVTNYYLQYLDSLEKPVESPLFSGAHVYTYTTFMRAFLRKDSLNDVSRVYQDMIARHIQPTLVTYATLMLAHAFIPDPESCERIFRELKNNNVKLNTVIYTILMRAWAKSGRWEKVKSTYDLMKEDDIKPTKLTMEVLRYGKNRNNQ